MTASGYDLEVVRAWLAKHAVLNPGSGRGRRTEIRGQALPESHRDTINRWLEHEADEDPPFIVPLGRWDEILMAADVPLWEFEDWAERTLGWNGYINQEESHVQDQEDE